MDISKILLKRQTHVRKQIQCTKIKQIKNLLFVGY